MEELIYEKQSHNKRHLWKRFSNKIHDFFYYLDTTTILYALWCLVVFCVVCGIITLFVWIGTGFGYESVVVNFISSHKDTLMQEYFKNFNVGDTKYYTDGYLSTLINDLIEKNHYFTNPWFGYYWSVNDLYVNLQTHTITFNLYDYTWQGVYSMNWAIPSNI